MSKSEQDGPLGSNADGQVVQGMPAVSVVIPTFNHAGFVLDAVRSVLRQTFQDFEIIVIDDGPDDDVAMRVRSLKDSRIRLVRHKTNKGAAAARNSGVAAARGRYIAFLDSDDLWMRDKLAKQVAFLDAGSDELRASCTGYHYISPRSQLAEERVSAALLTFDDFLLGCRCSPGTTLMVETSLFQEVGPFDEALMRLEDWDWLLRCARISSVGVVQEPLAVIDASLSGLQQHQKVTHAAQIFWSSWRKGEGRNQSRRNNRLLHGTLWNEISASAYLSGRYTSAASSFIVSLWLLPDRKIGFYKRIAMRLRSDVSMAIRADEENVARARLVEFSR